MTFLKGAAIVGAVLTGAVLLFISISRAGLDYLTKEDNLNQQRVEDFRFNTFGPNGEEEAKVYRFPKAGLLPTHPFYGFKQVRNFIWLNLLSDPSAKARMTLFLADKKIIESRHLFKENQSKAALEAATEAIAKLKAANHLWAAALRPASWNLQTQLYEAGLAYHQILTDAKDTFEMNSEDYTNLINDLDNWNDTQTTNRQNQTD